MKVIWLRLARQDLQDIRSYYSEVAGKTVADAILKKIVKASFLLSQQPYIGQVSSLDNSGLIIEWVIPNTNYVIPYVVHDDEIRIYRVFDSRQDPLNSWD